jgi:hypothetical protein
MLSTHGLHIAIWGSSGYGASVCFASAPLYPSVTLTSPIRSDHPLTAPGMLQIGKMLDEDDFKVVVVPIISALFASPDHTIRNTLVANIDEYAPALSAAAVESSIFPQLLKGLQVRGHHDLSMYGVVQ